MEPNRAPRSFTIRARRNARRGHWLADRRERRAHLVMSRVPVLPRSARGACRVDRSVDRARVATHHCRRVKSEHASRVRQRAKCTDRPRHVRWQAGETTELGSADIGYRAATCAQARGGTRLTGEEHRIRPAKASLHRTLDRRTPHRIQATTPLRPPATPRRSTASASPDSAAGDPRGKPVAGRLLERRCPGNAGDAPTAERRGSVWRCDRWSGWE